MTISNKVKSLRLKKGLSQESLASAVNVTRQTIISLEKRTIFHLYYWHLIYQKYLAYQSKQYLRRRIKYDFIIK